MAMKFIYNPPVISLSPQNLIAFKTYILCNLYCIRLHHHSMSDTYFSVHLKIWTTMYDILYLKFEIFTWQKGEDLCLNSLNIRYTWIWWFLKSDNHGSWIRLSDSKIYLEMSSGAWLVSDLDVDI